MSSQTFKITIGEEMRRFSLPEDSTSEAFFSHVASLSPFPHYTLTWKDDEGDLISLRNEYDFEECIQFAAQYSSGIVKLTLTPHGMSDGEAAKEGEKKEVVEVDLDFEFEFEKELEKELEKEAGGGGFAKEKGASSLPPHVLKRLRKMNEKLGKQKEAASEVLEKKKGHPLFDEGEYERQLKVLSSEGIPIRPYIQILLAKRIIQKRKHEENHRGRERKPWKRGEDQWERKIAKFPMETRERLARLRENGLPAGPLVGFYLQRWLFNGEMPETGDDEELKGLEEVPKEVVRRCILRVQEKRKKVSAF